MNIPADVLRVEAATEASIVLKAKQSGYAADTRRRVYLMADGVTKRYWWDSTRLADLTGAGYGSALVGTKGITGVTPTGGSLSAAGTVEAMLGGLKAYADSLGAASIGGTMGNLMKKTGAGTVGDSLLAESGNIITLTKTVDALTELLIYNGNNSASALTALGLGAGGAYSATLFTAGAGYTDEAAAAACLNIAVTSSMTAANFAMRSASHLVRYYFGSTMGSGTLFHTLSSKGHKMENIALLTDADGVAAGMDHSFSLTKNDANTRQFYGYKLRATLNAGGSNAGTTLNLLDFDTVNTTLTGLTVNLMRLAYGGSEKFKVSSAGNVYAAALYASSLTDNMLPYQNGGLLKDSAIFHNGVSGNTGIGGTQTNAKLYIANAVGGTGDIELSVSTSTPAPVSSAGPKIYSKGSKLIFVIDDGGTTRYKYLDLTGTGITWVHTTSAP